MTCFEHSHVTQEVTCNNGGARGLESEAEKRLPLASERAGGLPRGISKPGLRKVITEPKQVSGLGTLLPGTLDPNNVNLNSSRDELALVSSSSVSSAHRYSF
jgi:hypothetical protein